MHTGKCFYNGSNIKNHDNIGHLDTFRVCTMGEGRIQTKGKVQVMAQYIPSCKSSMAH